MRSFSLLVFVLVLFGCKVKKSNIKGVSPDNDISSILAKIEFIKINAGKFMMGSPDSEIARGDNEKQHEVEITKSFKMMKHEFSQGHWKTLVGNNPSHNRGDTLPVESVTWMEVQKFISILNGGTEKCGDTSTNEGFKRSWSTAGCYRLPTEAEWEMAARANTTTAFYSGANITTNQANYYAYKPYYINSPGRFRGQTVVVSSIYAENPWGLKHMAGNVREWTQDNYQPIYDLKSKKDPFAGEGSSNRVVRGGGWKSPAKYLRSAYRNAHVVDEPYIDIGFRLVKTL